MNGIIKIILTFLMIFCFGCAQMNGMPSLTLISNEIGSDSSFLKASSETVEEADSLTWSFIFFMFGKLPSHEAPLDRLLKKHNADLLIDAEMTSSTIGIPYIFFVRQDKVKGRPAKIISKRRN